MSSRESEYRQFFDGDDIPDSMARQQADKLVALENAKLWALYTATDLTQAEAAQAAASGSLGGVPSQSQASRIIAGMNAAMLSDEELSPGSGVLIREGEREECPDVLLEEMRASVARALVFCSLAGKVMADEELPEWASSVLENSGIKLEATD